MTQDNPPTLAPEVIDVLKKVSTATLTTQLFARGFRNTFMHGLSPVGELTERMVGQAFTLRNVPAREDLDVLSVFEDPNHPQRLAVEQTPPGQVLVMDCRGETRAASAGSILMTRLMVRGVAGCVTDGSLRDHHVIGSLDFPVFSDGAAATTNLALHHAVDVQVPIGCAGVPVYPGDVIVADRDGVICIPLDIAAEIATLAAEQERLEDFIASRIAAGAPLPGTYPPNEATREAYRKTLAADDAAADPNRAIGAH